MPLSLLDTGLIRVTIRYVRPLKPGGPLFYTRKIPVAVRSHHGGKALLRISLRTRDIQTATRKAIKLAAEHEALWAALQAPVGEASRQTTVADRDAAYALLASLGLSPGELLIPTYRRPDGHDPSEILDDHFQRQHGPLYMEARFEPPRDGLSVEGLLAPHEVEAIRLLKEDPGQREVLLSDALAYYLKEHDKGHLPRFMVDTKRALQHVFSVTGDLPLSAYKRAHANAVRDALIERGNRTTTMRRRINSIVAVFNVGLREFDLKHVGNPFEELKIAKEGQDTTDRVAFTGAELAVISKACRARDDSIRHLVALLADTGARLGEIAGLLVTDVILDHETPHIHIRPHIALGRYIKNEQSERRIPLVGDALWAATRALEASRPSQGSGRWLFPRYAADGKIKDTQASAAINKWIRKSVGVQKTCHSFRHAMRDRLRHAGIPGEFQDLIGGWGSRSVGQGYGEGYQLKQLQDHMLKVV